MARTRERVSVVFLLYMTVVPIALEARDAITRYTRVRGVGPDMTRLIETADVRSETFRALVDTIRQSNAIVIVQSGRCSNARFRSCLTHVEGNEQARNVRILVDTRVAEDRLMATIAHELHHATELLSDISVTDAAGVLRFYRQRARGDCGRGLSEVCETEEALLTETRVLDELQRSSRH
jgi:hypothetical protein